MGAGHIAELCQELGVHGRLRMGDGYLVIERSHHVKDPAGLVETLGQRREGEELVVDRFATYWLVRFVRSFPLPSPEISH